MFTRKEGVTHVHNIQGNILLRHGGSPDRNRFTAIAYGDYLFRFFFSHTFTFFFFISLSHVSSRSVSVLCNTPTHTHTHTHTYSLERKLGDSIGETFMKSSSEKFLENLSQTFFTLNTYFTLNSLHYFIQVFLFLL